MHLVLGRHKYSYEFANINIISAWYSRLRPNHSPSFEATTLDSTETFSIERHSWMRIIQGLTIELGSNLDITSFDDEHNKQSILKILTWLSIYIDVFDGI